MNQFLTLCMVAVLGFSVLVSGQSFHCHGNACGAEIEHALSDHGHDNGPAQQDTGDADDSDEQLAKSHLHGWHTHGMDAAMAQSYNGPFFDVSTVVAVFYTQPLASHITEPALKPPSLA